MANSPLKDVLAALGVIKNADPKLVSALSEDAALEKALDGGRHAEKLTDGEMVSDHWAAGQTDKSATKEEVKVGPTQEASGGGAEKMIREYSNVARQMHGVASVPEKLDAMMGALGAVGKALEVLGAGQKSVAEALGKNNTLLVTMISETAKGKTGAAAKAEDEEEEDEEDEESEVVEINASRAKSRIRKAKKILKSVKAKKAEMEEEEDEAKCKSLKSEIAALVKKAGKLLADAQTFAYAASNDELKKSVLSIASKADINVVQEEEDEEEEEEEGEGKSKKSAEPTTAEKAAAEAANKAKADDKGNQSDSLNAENGNQAAAAKAIEDRMSKIDEALKGISLLSTDVRGMMDVVAGKTKLVDSVVIKAGAEINSQSLIDRISQAEDSGSITPIDGMAARDIASKLEMVKAGKIDPAFVNDRLSKTSSGVRALFAEATTKAA